MHTRILGIDYGTKRIGLALSDVGVQFAQPYSIVKNSKTTGGKAVAQIIDIIKSEQVSEIVLGESKDFKGVDNKVMSAIRDFKKMLEDALALESAFVVPVIFEPEFLTSHQAQHFQGKHDLLDASAAALILQSYLDRKNNQNK
jgi:putative holliday junction resolvase